MTSATQSSGRMMATFNGDFDELAALMNRSWSENREQPLRYTSAFLRSAFAYPGFQQEFAPAIYRDGRLVAFIAGSPRAVRIAGEPRKLLSSSFLTVAPDEKRAGYGPLVWGEMLKRARAAGYDGVLDYCVEGDAMNEQMPALARAFRQPTRRIFSVPYMARMLRPQDAAISATSDAVDPADVLLATAAPIAERVPLAKCWSQAEAQWQCRERDGARAMALAREGRRGVITGYSMETSGAATMQCVLLDNTLWDELSADERVELCRRFLADAFAKGDRMAITPVLGYADMEPLAAVGFRKTRRLLHAYLTLWNGAIPDPLPAMYMDVF